MKVLMVNKFLYPNGGSETYIFRLGQELEEKGHEVQYFGMEHEGRVVGNRVGSYTAGMDFHTGKIAKLLYPFRIIYSVEARRKIRKVLEDFEPDAVHLNNFNFQLTPSIIYEIRKFERRKRRDIKIVYTAHDFQLVCPNHMMRLPSSKASCYECQGGRFSRCARNKCIHGSRLKSILGSLEGYLYRFLKTYRQIDTVICPTHFMKEKLNSASVFRGKLVVMHNFIDPPFISKETKKDYVLYFGRFTEEKGVGTLIKVCRELAHIPFVFAGNGPLEEEAKAVDNIQCIGFLQGGELEKWIRGARFSICPSELFENCPFSVMESITYGTPVLGARIGGIPELVKDGKNGELFESGNAKDLRDKISSMWLEKEKMERYTAYCGEKQFDTASEYCDKLLELYGK